MYSVLVLIVLCWFATIYPKCVCVCVCVCKSHLFLKILDAPRKKLWCFFFCGSPCTQHFLIAYCPYSSFLFWFASIHSKCVCKSIFCLNFWVLRKRSSDIASFVKHLPCSIFTMIVSWYYGFYFGFIVTYPKCMCKSLEILGAPRKKHRCCFFLGVTCA